MIEKASPSKPHWTDPFMPSSGATISACGTYRYRLWRQWDDMRPVMVWVMMNPSTADAQSDDPTIRRCIGFARREGYGGIDVLNVFALRATDPSELARHPDPVGPENERALLDARRRHLMSALVLAWGNPKGGRRLIRHYLNAAQCLVGQSAQCFGVNANQHPKHPLYIAAAAPLLPWRWPDGWRG